MKKLFLLLVITSFLISCTSSPMIGNDAKPFVVECIYKVDDNWCEYVGKYNATGNYDLLNRKPRIYLPARMFNVGDTIKINNLK